MGDNMATVLSVHQATAALAMRMTVPHTPACMKCMSQGMLTGWGAAGVELD